MNENNRKFRSEALGKYVILLRTIYGNLYLVDRNKTQNIWWSRDPYYAMLFNKKEAAEFQLRKLRFNNPRIIQIDESMIESQDIINNSKSMFENLTSQVNGLFGKVGKSMCRLTMNGNIAVNTSNGYKTYNVAKGTLTNVTNFCFNIGDEMFFIFPTNKVDVGDIILVGGKPKCVTAVDKKIITVIDYENSEIRQVVPERHVFMGSTYFYGKIVSMFGNSFKNGKGLGNIMKMFMVSQMMGGNSSNGGNSGFGQMMAMSIFMGKNNNPFDGMFDFDLDLEENEDENESLKEE